MRKTALLAVSLLLCVLLSVSALAQGTGRAFKIFVAPEVSWAVSPEAATDYYTMGFGISGGIEYPVGPNWDIIGMINYKTYSPNESMIADWWDDEGEYPGSTNISVSEGSLTAVTIAFQGKGSLKSPASKTWPYIKGGFGLSFAGADEIKVNFTNSVGDPQTAWPGGADNDTNISILIGIGLEMASSGPLSFFGEVGYEVLMLEEGNNPGLVPVRVGILF